MTQRRARLGDRFRQPLELQRDWARSETHDAITGIAAANGSAANNSESDVNLIVLLLVRVCQLGCRGWFI